jgi:hypothetical protein
MFLFRISENTVYYKVSIVGKFGKMLEIRWKFCIMKDRNIVSLIVSNEQYAGFSTNKNLWKQFEIHDVVASKWSAYKQYHCYVRYHCGLEGQKGH